MRILVVEDNQKLASNIGVILRHQNYVVEIVNSGNAAIEQAQLNDYQLIILDLGLPDIDGIEVCRQLRSAEVTAPILMLTARIDLESKVTGLDTGADDYLTKPFLPEELLARVRALLRRQEASKVNVIIIADLKVNLATRQVWEKDRLVDLSPIELRILEFLLLARGSAKNAAEICSAVWGERESDAMFSDTLKVHIARLRKKLQADIIKTVPGWGYMIDKQ
jgi:DNA-binding response OmpR family regulator